MIKILIFLILLSLSIKSQELSFKELIETCKSCVLINSTEHENLKWEKNYLVKYEEKRKDLEQQDKTISIEVYFKNELKEFVKNFSIAFYTKEDIVEFSRFIVLFDKYSIGIPESVKSRVNQDNIDYLTKIIKEIK